MWNLINNNFICGEKELLRVNKIHLEKLLNIKSNLNNKAREVPFFLKNKSYLREIIRTERNKRNKDNNTMYKKLVLMATSPSPYSKCHRPKYCPAFDKHKFNYNKIEREINIYNDNVSFFKRFSNKKSVYSTEKYLKKSDYENYIKFNISKTRFLPKIPLKLCTFRQFKSNLFKESSKIKESIKNILESQKLNNKEKIQLIKSNSMNNLFFQKNNRLQENLRYNNNKFNLNNINNLSDNDLYYLNNYSSSPKIINIKRSQSALNNKLMKNNLFV